MLCRTRRYRCRRWDIRPLEIVRGEIGDTVSDCGGELGYGFLDLDGVVVGFGVVDFENPCVRGVRG